MMKRYHDRTGTRVRKGDILAFGHRYFLVERIVTGKGFEDVSGVEVQLNPGASSCYDRAGQGRIVGRLKPRR